MHIFAAEVCKVVRGRSMSVNVGGGAQTRPPFEPKSSYRAPPMTAEDVAERTEPKEPSEKEVAKSGWLEKGTTKRRLLIALAIYVLAVVVFAIVAGPERMGSHTPFNHFAHLADAWLHGRQDLRNGAPAYAQGNDFAIFEGKTFISFPPFPAVLMLPMVALAGSPENFRDGQFIVWLAGVGPAVLFLILEKLRRTARSERTETENIGLALIFAFGTVYFFTSVEGFVWFAGHVVGVAVGSLYILFALDAERPLLSGALMGATFLTRPSMLYTSLLFGFEALRVSSSYVLNDADTSLFTRVKNLWSACDKGALVRRVALFSMPVIGALLLASWMNYTRFHNPSPAAFGHEHLSVVWKGRIEKWGLFGYHYLSKNLGCFLTILPWLQPNGAPHTGPLFRINEHGLALWFTTPIYLWLLWPKRKDFLWNAIGLSALLPLVMDLLYQNSGWRQFGYRFSNDYALLLFILIAINGRSFSNLFKVAAVWGLAWNLFGAVTFDRANYDSYYFREGTQQILYQAD